MIKLSIQSAENIQGNKATTYSSSLLIQYLETLLRKEIKIINLMIKLLKSATDKKVPSFKIGFNWLAFQNVKNNSF